MEIAEFWLLIDEARSQTTDPLDGEAVTARCSDLLARYPRETILAAQQIFWDRMADSYRYDVWAAAYLINGGCSDPWDSATRQPGWQFPVTVLPVADALGLTAREDVPWTEGTDRAYRYGIYVGGLVDGWVLVHGRAISRTCCLRSTTTRPSTGSPYAP